MRKLTIFAFRAPLLSSHPKTTADTATSLEEGRLYQELGPTSRGSSGSCMILDFFVSLSSPTPSPSPNSPS